jgi:hypothetical protein
LSFPTTRLRQPLTRRPAFAFDFENVAIQVLDVVLAALDLDLAWTGKFRLRAALSTSITHVTLVLLTVVLICGPPATGSATMV